MKTITLVTKKKNSRKKKVNTSVTKEEKMKGKKKKKQQAQHIGELKVNFKGIFGSSFHEFLHLSFLSILERKLFDGL